MAFLLLEFASNFVLSWVIPIGCVCACDCACVAGENQALGVRVLHFPFFIFISWQNKTKLIFLCSRIRVQERIYH